MLSHPYERRGGVPQHCHGSAVVFIVQQYVKFPLAFLGSTVSYNVTDYNLFFLRFTEINF